MPAVEIQRHVPPLFELFGYGVENGGSRYYVAALDTGRRMIVICRNDLILEDLGGNTVSAKIGQDPGTLWFVRFPYIDLRHTKVTIYRKSDRQARLTLYQIMTAAPELTDP